MLFFKKALEFPGPVGYRMKKLGADPIFLDGSNLLASVVKVPVLV
jgi:hypothetical protein